MRREKAIGMLLLMLIMVFSPGYARAENAPISTVLSAVQPAPVVVIPPVDDPSGRADKRPMKKTVAPSEFENYISGKVDSEVSTDLRQFGYEIFSNAPSTFAPADNIPVSPDYVLGPGDEVVVDIWGNISGTWKTAVDRNGNLSLEKVGVLGVAGLTFTELKQLLHKEFSKYYTGFEMSISLGALRTIKVYVVGNTDNPGAYTVSSLSTLINALFAAGGPNKSGTMRGIQLRRNDNTIVTIDLYDFLLRGDKSSDLRLMPEDVIFIPPVGPLFAIAGSVHTPAIYEIKGEVNVSQLIEMAGGLSMIAFHGRMQIFRISEGSRKIVFESNLDEAVSSDIKLAAGDIVKIFPVIEDIKMVRLEGAVFRPGNYGYKSGMTIRDLVMLGGGLRYYAYTKEAEMTRINVTDGGPVTEMLKIDLEGAISGSDGYNPSLHENDYLFIRAIPEWELYRKVALSGEVRFPGIYTINKGERLSSIIERAGGFTDKAYFKGSVFTRESVRQLQQRSLDEAADRLERELSSQSIATAQNALTAEASTQQQLASQQQRALLQKMRSARAAGRMVMNIASPETLQDTPDDILLEEGDSLYIPQTPSSIQVIGSVYNSTSFIYDPLNTVSQYIQKAGGTTRYSDEKNIFVLKSDGSAESRRQKGWSFMSSGLDPGDTVVVPEVVERVAWLREIKDITQILYQIAVTAGVLIVAF